MDKITFGVNYEVVQSELPPKENKILAKSEYGEFKVTNGYHYQLNNCTAWLRKKKDSTILTRSQLEELLGNAFEEGRISFSHEIGGDNEYEPDFPAFKNKQQYITSIISTNG